MTYVSPKLFKIYLKNNDGSLKEIRKFNSEAKTRLDFNYVCEKLKQFFPELHDKDFTISWIDEDKDEIQINSDPELVVAMQTYSEQLKLHVHLCWQNEESRENQIPKKKEGVRHFRILCDGCNGPVKGFRYKCIQCKDYDLCSQCETLGLHANHCMIRISQPTEWSSPHGQRLLHDIRKFLRKNGVHLSKKDIPDKFDKSCPMSRIRHEFSAPNDNVSWSSVLHNFVEQMTGARFDDAGPSKEGTKQEKEECQTNVTTGQTSTEKILEDTKLVIDSTDKTSDNASVSITETTIKKTEETGEWTILDKNDTSDISSASSISSSLTNVAEKKVSTDSPLVPSAPKEINTSDQTIYPELPKEENIYHPNPKIREALKTMIAMGFSNKLGLLTYLLEAEDGNINKVTDLLLP